MQNKAPQGNHNSSPTPERELERYGVWVKAEPQDVVEEPAIGRKTLDSASVDDSDAMLLSEEEEDILDSFDLPDELVEEKDSTSTDTSSEAFDDLSLDEPFELIDELPEESRANEPSMASDLGDESIVDMSLDDFDFEPTAEPEHAGHGSKAQQAEPMSSADSFATTDISIEEFGLGDEPEDATGPSLESLGMHEESSGQPAKVSAPLEAPGDEFESLDIDLQFDDTIPTSETNETVDALGFDTSEHDLSADFESVDIDSIGAETPASSAQPSVQPEPPKPQSYDMGTESSISMDSFIDKEDGSMANAMPDLGLDNATENPVPGSGSAQHMEPSSDLLKQIALELSSIKEELVSLRSQLGNLRAEGKVHPASGTEPEVSDEAATGGFFDDEDDDTIALTGDELDNILNTADFTEEAALADELNEAEIPQVELPEEIDLLPEDGDYASHAKPGIEPIELAMVEPTSEEAETLESLTALDDAEGIAPLTAVPEDTTFLDEDSSESLAELDGMPLEDVPLVEPNPSDLDVIMDSTFGSEDEELPMAEAAVEEIEEIEPFELPTEADQTELVLNVDGEDRPVVSTVDSFPEKLDEIDDVLALDDEPFAADAHGVDLHTEESAPLAETDDDIELLESIDDDDTYINSTEPVEFHPDDIPTSLDDSLFVEAAVPEDLVAEPEPAPEPMVTMEKPVPPARPQPQTIMEPTQAADVPEARPASLAAPEVPDKLKHDVKSVLLYLDQLLASLPEEKIEEFASSEYYDTYKRLFDDLGLL
jgi:hypothetical protein